MTAWMQLLGGGVLLYFGAEWFVGGASALALALRVPQLIVGLTVVAYGTSAPEIIVGVEATLAGHGDVALGNVVGSNIANVGLVLGVAALVRPARVDGALRRRELPVLLGVTALLPVWLWDGRVSRAEGLALLAVAAVYTAWMAWAARSAAAVRLATEEVAATSEAADLAGAPVPGDRVRSAGVALAGLVVLLVGGNLFVGGAVSVAQSLGLSERLVGLTLVAVGTSLPELITSVVAARRGHSDLAVGNVVGSNIFNLLLCLGAAALAGPVGRPLADVAFDLTVLGAMTLLAAVLLRTERRVSRWEGGLALGAYGVAMVLTVLWG
jgi:cation:H+ antiporter